MSRSEAKGVFSLFTGSTHFPDAICRRLWYNKKRNNDPGLPGWEDTMEENKNLTPPEGATVPEVPEKAAPAEEVCEPAAEGTPVIRRRRGKHRWAAPIGGAYIILAIIGAIAVVFGAGRLYETITDDSALLRQIERQIQPVMMFDPVPFADIADVDNNILVKTSVWSCLYSDKRSGYSYDDNGMILIPVSDVDVAAANLYGPDVHLTHTSMEEDGISYTYDAENNVYRVPMMAQGGYYTPMVVSMERVEGDLYEVTVGYIPPGATWTASEDGDSYRPTPDKYMIYVMRRDDDNYYLVALEDPGQLPADTTTPNVVPGLDSSSSAAA